MRKLAVAMSLSVGAPLLLAASCSGDGTAAGPDVGAAPDASTTADSLRDRAPADDDAYIPDPAPPPGLPDGWVLDRTYDRLCSIYVSGDASRLPPPPTWEACPSAATPSGVQCRLLSSDSDAETAGRDVDGKVLLGVGRDANPNWVYAIVTEPDGPVRAATLSTDQSRCNAVPIETSGGHYTIMVYDRPSPNGNSGYGGGILAGATSGPRPTLAVHLDPTTTHHAYAAPFAILDLTLSFEFRQFAWTDGTALATLWSAAMDDHAQQGRPTFGPDSMIWGAGAYHWIHAYRAGGSVVNLLYAGMDPNHGYDDPGTDGTDLVWIEAVAANRTTPSQPFDTYTIMTAPYTTDPALLKPRRLRSETGPALGSNEFVVGCGYAARTNDYHVRLVRLSDGVSWVLDNPGLGSPWAWYRPLAVTCDELFSIVSDGKSRRVARARLDSLGPGLAPD